MVLLRVLLRIAGGYEICGGLGSAGVACAVIAVLTDPYVWSVVASGLVGAAIVSLMTRAIPNAKRRRRRRIAQEMRDLLHHLAPDKLHDPMSVSHRHILRQRLTAAGLKVPDFYAMPDTDEVDELREWLSRVIPFIESFSVKAGVQAFLKGLA